MATRGTGSPIEELHRLFTRDTIRDVGPESGRFAELGKGHHFGGLTVVGRHHLAYRRRRFPVSAESRPPVGQAALWFDEVRAVAPLTAVAVARQLARLCRDDSKVTVPIRSLADAVGLRNSAGHLVAYTERGVEWLVESEWIVREVAGRGCAARTTYYLSVGH